QPDSTTSGDNNSPDPSATVEQPDIIEQRPSQTLPGGLERVETPAPNPVVGEVPAEIMNEIIADLTNSTGAERDTIQVVIAESVLWNDGALGCPKPGEFYIQMMINGYWVVLEMEGIEYDYRVSDKGSFKLCEGENMPPVNSTDTSIQNPLIAQAKEDLAERLGIPTTEIELLKIEEVTWRDGSLGCPQPGMLYTQALVNGSLIQLMHKDTVYQYHSGKGGPPFLCENPTQGFEGIILDGEEPKTPPELSDK
ncbi:MAG: hypothetical protein MUO67_08170, partial [Anaerolineales bacterium]|nr:hypothetical protein [Anaerolineales bacterium]